MTEFLLGNALLGAVSVVVAAVSSTLLWYALLRFCLRRVGRVATDNLVTVVVNRLGTLYALILALMFAQEMNDYREIRQTISLEATAISQLSDDLRAYQEGRPAEAEALLRILADYLEQHIRTDRAALSKDRLSRRTWLLYRRIDEGLRALAPETEELRDLRSQMLTAWEEVSRLRRQIELSAAHEVPILFWVVALSGFFAVVFPFAIYPAGGQNLLLLGVFAAFNGIVLYAILAVQSPFEGPGSIQSTTQLDAVLQTLRESLPR